MSFNRVNKKMNSYTDLLSSEFYERCPKAVVAAIAVSFAILQGNNDASVEDALLTEWTILHKSGIVPQKPYRDVNAAKDC